MVSAELRDRLRQRDEGLERELPVDERGVVGVYEADVIVFEQGHVRAVDADPRHRHDEVVRHEIALAVHGPLGQRDELDLDAGRLREHLRDRPVQPHDAVVGQHDRERAPGGCRIERGLVGEDALEQRHGRLHLRQQHLRERRQLVVAADAHEQLVVEHDAQSRKR